MQTCVWPSWCHCHSLSLASVKSRLLLLFWCRPTQLVPEKGLLNECVCVDLCTLMFFCAVLCQISANLTDWGYLYVDLALLTPLSITCGFVCCDFSLCKRCVVGVFLVVFIVVQNLAGIDAVVLMIWTFICFECLAWKHLSFFFFFLSSLWKMQASGHGAPLIRFLISALYILFAFVCVYCCITCIV